MLPLAALVVFDGYSSWRSLQETGERSTLEQAHLLAGNITATLEGARQVAKAIVAHVAAAPLDSAACGAYLRAIVRAEPRYFGAAVFAPDGTPWCRSTPGTPDRPDVSVGDRAYFQAALRSTDLVVGDVIVGRLARRPALPVAMAYRGPDGQAAGVVFLPLNLQDLAQSVGERFRSEHGFVLIVDRHGTVAAGAPDHAGSVARSVPADALTALYEGGVRIIERLEFRDRSYIVGLVPLTDPATGLVVMVGLDRELTLAPARRTLILGVAVSVLALLTAILLAWWVGRRLIETPIRRFVEAAQRQAAGDLGARFPEARPGTEFGRLGEALNIMVAEIERLIEQKSLLVREVQHRVMNSLQLLSAFLHLQSRQVDDPAIRKYLVDARERIHSLSVIYRHLYHSEATSTVEFGETLKALCAEMERTYFADGGPRIEVRAERLTMPMETALSLALIVHELVTNAVKHAYGAAGGPLLVELARVGDQLRLAVTDQGRGLPGDFDMEHHGSLGMTVIQTLARQLHGSAAAERLEPGTRFTVTFPASDALAAA